MEMPFRLRVRNYGNLVSALIGALFAFLIFLNINYVYSTLLGIVLFSSWCFIVCRSLRAHFLKRCSFPWILSLGVFLLFISGIGAILFYLHAFHTSYFLVLLFPTLFLIVPATKCESNSLPDGEEREKMPIARNLYLVHALVLSLITIELFILISYRTGAHIRSPWQVIPVAPFVTVYLLITFFIVMLLSFTSFHGRKLMWLIVSFSMLTHSVFITTYEIIYGQDICRNIAWMRFLSYGGEPLSLFIPLNGRSMFSLAIVISQITQIDVYWIARFLVPVLFSVFIPIITFELIGLIKPNDRPLQWVGSFLSVGMFPFLVSSGNWTSTSNFATIWLYFSIFLWLKYVKTNSSMDLFLALFCTMTTGAAHLIQGIASLEVAIISLLSTRISNLRMKTCCNPRRILKFVSIFTISLTWIFPLFLLQFRDNTFLIQWQGLDSIIQYVFPGQLGNPLTFLHGLSFYVLGGLGIFLAMKEKTIDTRWILITLSLMIVLFIDGFVAEYMILGIGADLWRYVGVSRLLIIPYIAFLLKKLVSLPRGIYILCVYSGNKLIKKTQIRHAKFLGLILISVIICPLITSSFYDAYPGAWGTWGPPNVSKAQIEAIRYVYETTSEPFVALTDHVTGSAALSLYGIYDLANPGVCYWTPSGRSEMSHLFCKLVETQNITHLKEIMAITNVDIGYLFLSDYNIQPNVINTINATLELYSVFSGYGEHVYVFRLTRWDIVYRYPHLRKYVLTNYGQYNVTGFSLSSQVEKTFTIPDTASDYNGSYTFVLAYKDDGHGDLNISLLGKEEKIELGNTKEIKWAEIGNLSVQPSIRIGVMLTITNGAVSIKGMWLIPSAAVSTSRVNLITKIASGFEGENLSAMGWNEVASGDYISTLDNSTNHSGFKSLKVAINGSQTHYTALYYVRPHNSFLTLYRLSCWSKAKDVNTPGRGWYYSIQVRIFYTDGTYSGWPFVAFTQGTHDWEQKSLVLRTDPMKIVSSFAVKIELSYGFGTAWFDYVELTVEAES